jgi:hypothetical protein
MPTRADLDRRAHVQLGVWLASQIVEVVERHADTPTRFSERSTRAVRPHVDLEAVAQALGQGTRERLRAAGLGQGHEN